VSIAERTASGMRLTAVSFGVVWASKLAASKQRLAADVNIILGHGVDVVNTAELERWISDPSDPLIPRCFVPEELDEIGDGPDRIDRLAGRFAAKEAVLKALGTGFGAGVAFSDVVIRRAPGEPPQVRLAGGAARVAAERGISAWYLSISHCGAIAIASAIALGEAHQDKGSARD
jgi:holo-[acyl-carrier protein] synthase